MTSPCATCARTAELVVCQGATSRLCWPLTIPTGQPGAGGPVDTTVPGFALVAQARRGSTLLHEWSDANPGSVEYEVGRVCIVTPAAVSSAWEWRSALYGVELTWPDGEVQRIGEGMMLVSLEVVV